MLVDDKMRDEYSAYLSEHISNVKMGFEWLVNNLPELFHEYDIDYLRHIMRTHDKSKWDAEEYEAYCAYFYGTRTKEVKEEFDKAWLRHQQRNPHHWQHWLLRNDNGSTKCIEIPYEFILEMIVDHWSFSWKKGNLCEIFDWYDSQKDKILLHDKSRKVYEDILAKMRKILENKKDQLDALRASIDSKGNEKND